MTMDDIEKKKIDQSITQLINPLFDKMIDQSINQSLIGDLLLTGDGYLVGWGEMDL